MSVNELAVVIICAVIGYLVVAKILARSKAAPNRSETAGARPGTASDAEMKSQAQREPEPEPRREREPDPTPWYRTLEVSPNASTEDIRQAYRRLMGQYHPDKVASLGDELKAVAERKSKEITVAYREAMQSRGEW